MNYQAIAQAMQVEIDNPKACYTPCSPVEFVRDRLIKGGFVDEARWFWSRSCKRFFGNPGLDNLSVRLDALASAQTLDTWGT